MEDIFKQNLLNLRQPSKPRTFGEALFSNPIWKPAKQSKELAVAKIVISEEFSEKKQVLESLGRFAQEKLGLSDSGVVKIEGGEIGLKTPAVWNVPDALDISSLLDTLTLPSELLQLLLRNKNPEAVKVIFVTEVFRSWEDISVDLKEGFINELLVGFSLKTAEFFERMIKAMKLRPEEVILYPVDDEGRDLANEIMSIANFFKPAVIITLGAKAAQKILKVNDRLNSLHGEFFSRTLQKGDTFQVVPLYHPSIIETNQNMKKTAWTDMQKIMEHLKELS
jgi:uracil-DNA glycosylase family 4